MKTLRKLTLVFLMICCCFTSFLSVVSADSEIEEGQKLFDEFKKDLSETINDETWEDFWFQGSTPANSSVFADYYLELVKTEKSKEELKKEWEAMEVVDRKLWYVTYFDYAIHIKHGEFSKVESVEKMLSDYVFKVNIDEYKEKSDGFEKTIRNNGEKVYDDLINFLTWQCKYMNNHGGPYCFFLNCNYLEAMGVKDNKKNEEKQVQQNKNAEKENQKQAQEEINEAKEEIEKEMDEPETKSNRKRTKDKISANTLTIIIIIIILGGALGVVFYIKKRNN